MTGKQTKASLTTNCGAEAYLYERCISIIRGVIQDFYLRFLIRLIHQITHPTRIMASSAYTTSE